MDHYLGYIITLNKYAKGIELTVSEDWEESISTLIACYDDLNRLNLVNLGVIGEDKEIIRKRVINFTLKNKSCKKFYRDISFLDDIETIADGMREQAKEIKKAVIKSLYNNGVWTENHVLQFLQKYNSCINLWEEHATDLKTEFEVLGLIPSPDCKEQITQGNPYDINVCQLFTTVDDCKSFFECKDANTMSCASWGGRACFFERDRKLTLKEKGSIKNLYEEIKLRHTGIAT